MIARDIMHRRIISVPANMTLKEAAKVLTDKHISGVPVLDEEGKMVGVLSQTDLVRQEREAPTSAATPEYYSDAGRSGVPRGFQVESPDFTRVREAMTPVVLTADESTSVKELARIMIRRHIHRLVITRQGKPAGIVSSLDLLKAVIAEGE